MADVDLSVPCYKRVKQVDSHQENFEKVIEVDGDEDGGWVDTHHFAGASILTCAVHFDLNRTITQSLYCTTERPRRGKCIFPSKVRQR